MQSYSWNVLSSLPTPLGFVCGGIYNNTIHVLGGYDNNGLQQNEYTATIQWDQTMNTIGLSDWSVSAISETFPSIAELGSDTQQYVTVNEFIYIMGTDDRNGMEDAPGKLLIYNMKTQTFKDTTTYSSAMTVARSGNCIATDKTYLYSVGGHDAIGYATADFLTYHIHNNVWSTEMPINNARYSAQCVLANRLLYVIGGGSHTGAVLTMEILDLNGASAWTVASIPSVISSSFAYSVDTNGIYLLGGATSVSYGSAVDATYFYDITNETWSMKDPLRTATYGFASVMYQPVPEWMFIINIGGVLSMNSCGFFCVNSVYTSAAQYTKIAISNISNSLSETTISPTAVPSYGLTIDSTVLPTNINATVDYQTTLFTSPISTESDETLKSLEAPVTKKGLFGFVFGHFFYIMISIGAIDFLVFVGSLCYIFTGLRKRAKEPNNASWIEALKEFKFMQYIAIAFELFDLTTDYLFATDLIVEESNNALLVALGWTSLLIAIFGLILFLCKYSLLKKLLAVQIKRYRGELKHLQNTKERTLVMKQIRIRKIDIDVLSLLNSSVEDLPQTMIILIYLGNFGFSYISVVSISISILSFLLKLFAILMTSFGCNDVDDKVSTHGRVSTHERISTHEIRLDQIEMYGNNLYH